VADYALRSRVAADVRKQNVANEENRLITSAATAQIALRVAPAAEDLMDAGEATA